MKRPAELAALALLLILGGLALMGPYGVLSWGENKALLEKRQHRIAVLTTDKKKKERVEVKFDPEHVDPDMASELVRKDLNVARPDEYVIQLDRTP